MDPALSKLIETSERDQKVEVIARVKNFKRIPPEMYVVSRFGDVVTARISSSLIESIWADDAIASLKAPHLYKWDCEETGLYQTESLHIEKSDYAQRTTENGSGKRSIVAICDWGIDFAHENFRNPDGSTRFLGIWNQAGKDLNPPEPFEYGTFYSRAKINRALKSNAPYDELGYHPGMSDPFNNGSHGTHVTGIAAGNGQHAQSIRSAAWESDLIFVHLAAGLTPGLSNLGDSSRLLEAFDFLRRFAGGRPWVCNASLGRCAGEHTGRNLVERGIDNLVQNPGCAIVMSTGNYHSHRTHAHGVIRENEEKILEWRVYPSDRTLNEMEIWYPGSDLIDIEIIAPDGTVAGAASLGEKNELHSDELAVGKIYHRYKDPNNRDNMVDIFLESTAPAGKWKIVLKGRSIADGNYYAWIERDPGPAGTQSRFSDASISQECTTGTICNGFFSIAVGAVDAHQTTRPIARFSSGGRLRTGRFKPDILAPGVKILAEKSAPLNADSSLDQQTRMSGTSMAAPHVTAAVAVILSNPQKKLHISETRKILFETADRHDSDSDSSRSGNGVLNLDKAAQSARAY